MGGFKGKDKSKFVCKSLTIMASNCNGLTGKIESLHSALKFLDYPMCVCLQETKLTYQSTFQLDGYQVFEKIRKSKGGGLLTAVSNSLNPVLIHSDNDEI